MVGDEVGGLKGVYFERRLEHGVSEQAGKEEVESSCGTGRVEVIAEEKEEKERFARLE